MSKSSKIVIVGLAVIMAAGLFTGCKKSDPETTQQRTSKQQADPPPTPVKVVKPIKLVKPVEPKVVGPRIVEPAEADIAAMEVALESSDFKRGIRIKAGGEYIDVRIGHLVPCITDWNNDGKKDMVMGQFSGGAITLFENIGTDEAPVFGEGKPLLAGDKPIKLDAG